MTPNVLPDHNGGAIYSLSSSILEHFGADAPSPALRDDLLPAGTLGGRRVVHLLLDAFGLLQMREAVADGLMPNLRAILADAHVSQMTSVFPSTTTAAITSISHAMPPGRHGVLGFQMFFEELDMVANVIGFKAMDGSQKVLPLEALKREQSIYQRLGARGVRTFATLPNQYDGTPFTKLLYDGATILGYDGAAEIPTAIRQAASISGDGPMLVSAYWAMIDILAHRYGPMSAPYRTELRMVDGLLHDIAATCRELGATLVILADHGQANLPAEKVVPLPADVARQLRRIPAGERRTMYLSTPNADAVAERLVGLAPHIEAFRTDSEQAAALYGAPLNGFRSRAGDLCVRFTDGGQFLFDRGYNKTPEPGGHGSTTQEEMLVPLVVYRA